MEWPLAAVLMTAIVAFMVIVATYLSREKKAG